jgi:hypothetical protein
MNLPERNFPPTPKSAPTIKALIRLLRLFEAGSAEKSGFGAVVKYLLCCFVIIAV